MPRLDPPYYVKGQHLYANHYEDNDHAKIARFLVDLPFPCVVSYDDAPPIRQLYRGWRRMRYTLRYTAAERQHGAEVMFFSAGLELPKCVVKGALRSR